MNDAGGLASTARITVTIQGAKRCTEQPHNSRVDGGGKCRFQHRRRYGHGTDLDTGDSLTYSLVDNAGNFTINSTTGQIRVGSTNNFILDYETAPEIKITVRVTDSSGAFRDQIMTVALTNVNDAPRSTQTSHWHHHRLPSNTGNSQAFTTLQQAMETGFGGLWIGKAQHRWFARHYVWCRRQSVPPGFQLNALTQQSDGKIVAAGISSGFDYLVLRYNSDGTLDSSFDQDGIATFSLSAGSEWAASVAMQSDGKIVVGGSVNNGVIMLSCD